MCNFQRTICLLITVNCFVSCKFYSFTYVKYASFHKIFASSHLLLLSYAIILLFFSKIFLKDLVFQN